VSVLRIGLTLTADGAPLAVPRLLDLAAGAAETFHLPLASGATFGLALPESRLQILTGLLLMTTVPLTVLLNNQTDGGIPLTAVGILLVTRVRFTGPVFFRVTNPSAQDGRIRGVILGEP
jgi:hypothetical protein